MTAQIKLEREAHIAKLTISNPPANTWTLESLNQLKELAIELSNDRSIYALVLTGEGGKFFSAGADLNNFASGDKSQAADMAFAFGEAFEALSAFDGVSIAAINGYAMGGGLEVAMACDIRIAEEQVQMALPEASVGLLPCAGGTQNLTALVGEGWAKRMILCGERVTAERAEKNWVSRRGGGERSSTRSGYGASTACCRSITEICVCVQNAHSRSTQPNSCSWIGFGA